MPVTSDNEIALAADRPIQKIGAKRVIDSGDLLPCGSDGAMVSQSVIDGEQSNADGNLILVTTSNPTPAGEGETTTTVDLGDRLNWIRKRGAIFTREASLGPYFGMKGGSVGGDFQAATIAHTLLSAMIGNQIRDVWGNIDETGVSSGSGSGLDPA